MENETEAREEATRQYNLPGGIRNLEAYTQNPNLTESIREYLSRVLEATQKRNSYPDTRIWKLTPSLIEKLTA